MILALTIAAALFGQETPASAEPAQAKPPAAGCSPTAPDPDSREVVVCVQKPQGYRIDPDVLAAKKARREALAGRLKTPQEKSKDRSCTVVGPAGCVFDAPGINLLAAAATLGEISQRLAKGQEVGSIFVTDPQMSEYQYYQAARKEREAKEAAKAVKEYAAAAKAKTTAETPAPAPVDSSGSGTHPAQ